MDTKIDSPNHTNSHFDLSNSHIHPHDDDDADTASQRSISLSSPVNSSPRHSIALSDHGSENKQHDQEQEHDHGHDVDEHGDGHLPNLAHEFLSNLKHESHPYTLDTDFSSEADDTSLYGRDSISNTYDGMASPLTSAAPSIYDGHVNGLGLGSGKRHSFKFEDEPPQTATFPHESALPHPEPLTATRALHSTDPSPPSVHPKTPTVPPSFSSNLPTYPPTPIASTPIRQDTDSITSFASTSSTSRKTRPESTLVPTHSGPLVLGVALVDFNHLQGPRIEFSKGEIFDDAEISANLPFLALPDGAHLSVEDYSYFHIVPSSTPNPSTIFGISCNRQIATAELLTKDSEVTRSTVQKAVVILASKPAFGPIRDKLGVVTRALFEQRDFRETGILVDFAASLEVSLRSQLTESGLYMGTSLRELVHTFRQRTLILLKALILQKRIMFYGHPVERLCTYQYSLISLLPGLLQTLEDCGSPPLATRAKTLTKPNSLKTSDRKSMMAYMGLPLDVFGKDAFFQPYIPLQQLDMIKDTGSWLCGSTNNIVTQQKVIDLLVNTETGTVEFRDPKLERSAGLTAADRKWMDEIVRDVNEGWNDEDPTRSAGMQFKGSDDYLRTKFEEYISAALSAVRYRDFVAKGEGGGVVITGGSPMDATSAEDFNPLWMSEFKATNAYEVWERTTDSMLFDIVEPRHPCNEKPTVVSDIGLRLSEGVKDLKLDQQLAPTREAITRTITAGSTGFFKAVEGVRGRWQRSPSSTSVNIPSNASVSSVSSTPVEVSTPLTESLPELLKSTPPSSPLATAKPIAVPESPQRQKATASVDLSETRAAIGAWGAGIGSFLSTKAARFSLPRVASVTPKASPVADAPKIMEEAPKAPEAPVDTQEQENDKKADPEDMAVKNPDDTEHDPTTAPMMATAL